MTESAEPAVKPLGLFARIAGMLTAPRATFENVVKAPRPVGILFICALVIGIAQTIPQLDEGVRQSQLDMQVRFTERITGQPVTPEARTQMEQRQKVGAYFTVVGTLIFTPIITLIFTALYWVVFNAVLGGTAAFKQVLAVVTHAQVIGALGYLIAAPIQYMQGRITVGGPFNLGALVSSLPDGNMIKLILTSTNIFMIWSIVVTAIGLAALYHRKTLNIAIGLFVVYFLIAAALASVFGSFMAGMGR